MEEKRGRKRERGDEEARSRGAVREDPNSSLGLFTQSLLEMTKQFRFMKLIGRQGRQRGGGEGGAERRSGEEKEERGGRERAWEEEAHLRRRGSAWRVHDFRHAEVGLEDVRGGRGEGEGEEGGEEEEREDKGVAPWAQGRAAR